MEEDEKVEEEEKKEEEKEREEEEEKRELIRGAMTLTALWTISVIALNDQQKMACYVTLYIYTSHSTENPMHTHTHTTGYTPAHIHPPYRREERLYTFLALVITLCLAVANSLAICGGDTQLQLSNAAYCTTHTCT